MVDFASTALLPFALLVIALSFVAAILSDKLRASYTTVLIAMGFALSFLRIAGGLQSIPLDNTVILGLVVPPLIFEAAMRTRYEVFRAIHKTVWALAIFGVIVSAIVSGLVLNVALGLPLAVALTFGVIVAPTDPVSVVNILKKTKAPEGLTTLLETEAYFNNAPAVILFPIVTSLSFSPLQSASAFVYNFGGGAIVGLLISGGAELLYRMITEPLAETSFTIAVMFGSYILAESLGVSGLTAVAIAGLYMGNRTMQTAMSDETRTTVSKFWEVMTFLASSFALLLLGLNTDFSAHEIRASRRCRFRRNPCRSRNQRLSDHRSDKTNARDDTGAMDQNPRGFGATRCAFSRARTLTSGERLQRNHSRDDVWRCLALVGCSRRAAPTVSEEPAFRRGSRDSSSNS
jgi:NhaP-type Na+/H+ or K+/H+ antiporter